MKAAVLSLALFGSELITPVADHVPNIKSEALCKARSASDRFMNLPEAQSVADCLSDEQSAKDKLDTIWGQTAASLRNRCQSDAAVLGTTSYLDLLTCIQMADDVKWPSAADWKGAGRKRTKRQ
jgi:hypothetical protein